MSIKWKPLGYAAAIFLIGIAVGVILGGSLARRSLSDGPSKSEIVQMIRSHLQSRAGFTKVQVEKIESQIDQTAGQLEVAHLEMMQKIAKIFAIFHQEIVAPAELTDAQKRKLIEMEKRHEARQAETHPNLVKPTAQP